MRHLSVLTVPPQHARRRPASTCSPAIRAASSRSLAAARTLATARPQPARHLTHCLHQLANRSAASTPQAPRLCLLAGCYAASASPTQCATSARSLATTRAPARSPAPCLDLFASRRTTSASAPTDASDTPACPLAPCRRARCCVCMHASSYATSACLIPAALLPPARWLMRCLLSLTGALPRQPRLL